MLCLEPRRGQYLKLFSLPPSCQRQSAQPRAPRAPLPGSRLEIGPAPPPPSLKSGPQRSRHCPSEAARRPREERPHLLGRHHGYDRDALFPHHLPEVRAGVLQGSLGGDIVPFDSTDRDLKLERGFYKTRVCVYDPRAHMCSWKTLQSELTIQAETFTLVFFLIGVISTTGTFISISVMGLHNICM